MLNNIGDHLPFSPPHCTEAAGEIMGYPHFKSRLDLWWLKRVEESMEQFRFAKYLRNSWGPQDFPLTGPEFNSREPPCWLSKQEPEHGNSTHKSMEIKGGEKGHWLGKPWQIRIITMLKGNRAKGPCADGEWHPRDKNLFSVSGPAREVALGQRKL